MELNEINRSIELTSSQANLENSGNSQASESTDLKVRNYAVKALSCGECLAWAKYAKYVPGSPKLLKHASLPWIADTCTVIKTGLLIEEKVRHILSEESSLDEKIQDSLQIADLTLKLSSTEFVKCLPENMREQIQKAGKLYNVARLGYDAKQKADRASKEESSLGKARDVLDATRSAAWTAKAFLDLVSPEQLACTKISLKVGSMALSPAIGGLSAAKFAGDMLFPRKDAASAA